jgi:hypothetical protein
METPKEREKRGKEEQKTKRGARAMAQESEGLRQRTSLNTRGNNLALKNKKEFPSLENA